MKANPRRGMVVAILCIAACGGCAFGATPDTSDQGTAAQAEAGRSEQARQRIDACPVDSGTLIAGLRAMSLPCLADAASAVSVTAAHGRPEVINVWASWCVPCRRETALLEDVH